jgi:hypothetical protein
VDDEDDPKAETFVFLYSCAYGPRRIKLNAPQVVSRRRTRRKQSTDDDDVPTASRPIVPNNDTRRRPMHLHRRRMAGSNPRIAAPTKGQNPIRTATVRDAAHKREERRRRWGKVFVSAEEPRRQRQPTDERTNLK